MIEIKAHNSDIKMLTVKELSSDLRIGKDKAYALMKSKSFPSICIGKRYYVTEEALADWLRNYEYKEYHL